MQREKGRRIVSLKRRKTAKTGFAYYSTNSSASLSSISNSIKLRRKVLGGKRGGPCTPMPSWKMSFDDTVVGGFYKAQEEERPNALNNSISSSNRNNNNNNSHNSCVSARKLAANLWELQEIPRVGPALAMKKGERVYRDGKERDRSPLQLPPHLSDPSHSPRNPVVASNSSLRKQIASSLIQQHGSFERNSGALQAVSPASFSSSVEVGAHEQAITPTSSLDLKIQPRESGYRLTTSTELLKVLNRIWSLEEQHASSVSLVTALRVELDHARARVHELMQEQKADRHQIDSLIKKIADEKIVWRSKEQEKVRAAVQSVREELEDERKLRRRSESLHRKLARELAEVKTAFAKTLQDMERDKKFKDLMEDFCDELTKEVTDGKIHGAGEKEGSVNVKKEAGDQRKIQYIAEIWRESRIQMKLAEARFELDEKNSIMDRLRNELEAFMKANRANNIRNEVRHQKDDRESDGFRRQSLESMHLNGTLSAPQFAGDEDSVDSDLHSLELNKISVEENNNRSYKWGYASVVREETKSRKSSEQKISMQQDNKGQKSSDQRISFEDQLGSAMSWHKSKAQGDREKGGSLMNGSPWTERNGNRGGHYNKKNWENDSQDHGKISKRTGHTLARTESIPSECSEIKQDPDDTTDCYQSQASWRFRSVGSGIDHLLSTSLAPMHGLASPTRQWSHHDVSPDPERSISSFDRSKGIRENSLKAKLLEARLEGQQARLRSSKGHK